MKIFIKKTLIFFIPVFLPVLYYLIQLTTREGSGDIGTMAKLFFEKGYHNNLEINPDTLLVQNIEIQDVPDSTTILCFGDSFSQQKPFSYLQPLSEHYNKPIINVLYNIDYSPEEAATGFLVNAPKSQKPQIIIVESVERSCPVRLSKLDTTRNYPLEQLSQGKKQTTNTPLQSIDKEIILFYKLRLGWNNKTVFSKLNKPCFTSKGNEDELYSYYEDTNHYNDYNIECAANKLCQLYELAESRNVKLIYVIAPNKSSLYAPYTDNKNRYFTIENNPAFDTLAFYFNPIKLLRELEKKGEKDIYFCDDTHWTSKTAKVVGDNLTKMIIDKYGNLVN